MTKPLEIVKNDSRIRIGYRSPGLSSSLDANGKMELCDELGMSIIEPQIVRREFPDLAAAKSYKDAADSHGIEVTSAGVSLPYSDPDANCDGDWELDVAEALGLDYVFTLVSHPPEGISHQASWDLVTERLRLFVEKASNRGIRVALEPEWFLGSLERVRRMIKSVDHPNFALINFDPTNFYLNGSDPMEVIENHSWQIINGHIKDGYYQTNKRSESPVGDGELDWKSIFSLMLEKGGDYTMHIEHCGTAEKVIAAATVMREVQAVLG